MVSPAGAQSTDFDFQLASATVYQWLSLACQSVAPNTASSALAGANDAWDQYLRAIEPDGRKPSASIYWVLRTSGSTAFLLHLTARYMSHPKKAPTVS